MQAKEVFWHYFQQTGGIGTYLLSKQLEEDQDWYYNNDEAAEDEEWGGCE